MSSHEVFIDLDEAKIALERAWQASEHDLEGFDRNLASMIKEVLDGSGITYRYILITGILAKLVNTKAHPRAIQRRSKLPGAYDARSLCHSVVVPFEHTKGDLWGLSNEPFVNKPARHPEHDKSNPQLRDKKEATLVHDILDWAANATPDDLRKCLILIMNLGRKRLDSMPKTLQSTKSNMETLRHFLHDFLQVSDGGTRIVSVVAAFIQLLNPDAEVKVYSPNQADKFGKTAGDVELYLKGKLVCAFECKDRSYNENDIIHGVGKAVKHGISEYTFVSGFNSSVPDMDFESVSRSSGIDIEWIAIDEILRSWTVALNPSARVSLGELIIRYLSDMRRSEVAKSAQVIWDKWMNPKV